MQSGNLTQLRNLRGEWTSDTQSGSNKRSKRHKSPSISLRQSSLKLYRPLDVRVLKNVNRKLACNRRSVQLIAFHLASWYRRAESAAAGKLRRLGSVGRSVECVGSFMAHGATDQLLRAGWMLSALAHLAKLISYVRPELASLNYTLLCSVYLVYTLGLVNRFRSSPVWVALQRAVCFLLQYCESRRMLNKLSNIPTKVATSLERKSSNFRKEFE